MKRKTEQAAILWLALIYNRRGEQGLTKAEWPHFAQFCEDHGFTKDVVRVGLDGKPWWGPPGRTNQDVNYIPKTCPVCEDSACEVKSKECGT